ncbi:myosin light chain kinase 2, skeletal/cardiac muscle [Chanos chanos]|uniref:Myosin light chain kinase 2, skeletal/cardiac muscle n=1 Tax=Chanos chanos TaxID=29144 RepID=A0A6J2V4Z4_CHACN|nr:myosin light chain kinase 2, skeletal/cardiac muscle-like [Chanos chanos]
MSSNLVSSLAKVYDPRPLHAQKHASGNNGGKSGTRRGSLTAQDKSSTALQRQPGDKPSGSRSPSSLVVIERRVDALCGQMDKLITLQETALKRLDVIGREKGSTAGGRGVEEVMRDMRVAMETLSEKTEQQIGRLDTLERLVGGLQEFVSYIAETLKHSRLPELLKSTHTQSNKRLKGRDGKDKSKPNLKSVKTQKKKKPPDTAECVQAIVLEEVERLNQQNVQCSQTDVESVTPTAELLDLREEETAKETKQEEDKEVVVEEEQVKHENEEKERPISPESVGEEETPEKEGGVQEQVLRKEQDKIFREEDSRQLEESLSSEQDLFTQTSQACSSDSADPRSAEELVDVTLTSKRRVTQEDVLKDDLKKSRVEESTEELDRTEEVEGAGVQAAEGALPKPEEEGGEEEKTEAESVIEEYFIDCSPPPPAPFDHRVVVTKTQQITSYYTINREEVLGGGRFGMVHKCVEKSSGLTLAAKIIKARSQKEKEVVKSEIEVMNQLNHSNLIQLYAAFESRYDITLIMEYVDGGELFDRIIDENYTLTELDTVLFIRQIAEGLQYMHKMYILHLDLKPENILCVSRETNKVKIIDFGLARRYKPREKLRVNFGTPEFLAPEVINYEFVSFPTDMWSLGVITYMLLSGLSPFLGDDDNETLNNILACQWSFEEAEFADISEEAKDFISRLLVKSKSWRMSASQSLKHPWLSDRGLHYRLHQKKNKCHSSHAPPPES